MRVAWVLVLLACSGGATTSSTSPEILRVGVPPPSDEAGLRRALGLQVGNGGLWFADEECRTQFGRSRNVGGPELDAFAHCLAGLHLRATGRRDLLNDTSVLTDDAGFEYEARVVGGQLDFIGFSSRTADVATITPETLETLRVAGDRNATISTEQVDEVVVKKTPTPTHDETLQLCLTETGDIASVTPAIATSPESAAAFSAIVRGWKFKPFVVGGSPLPVCAIVELHYPAPTTNDRGRLPPLRWRSKAGNVVWNVAARKLSKRRIAGTITVVPDDIDKLSLNGKRIVGAFKLCIDETGHYESGTLIQSTGVPRYDAKLVKAMMAWVFTPYEVDGVSVPVCTAWTFIYSQSGGGSPAVRRR